jgi:single-strand DNA-binding protein
MAGVNKVILVGRVGIDPVSAFVGTSQYTKISLATSESWKDKSTGEKKEETEWHRITFWGRLAEIAAQYVKKGDQIYIEGSLKTEKWKDKETGQDRQSTGVKGSVLQLISNKRNAEENPAPAAAAARNYDSFDSFDEDAIPF